MAVRIKVNYSFYILKNDDYKKSQNVDYIKKLKYVDDRYNKRQVAYYIKKKEYD